MAAGTAMAGLDAETIASATTELDFVVSAAEQLAFATLSGDFNPLHLDADFARARGLDGPVVYGAMMLAKVSNIVGMRLPGSKGIWSAVKMEFRAPLYVGEHARMRAEVSHYSEATHSLSLKINVMCGTRVIATGSALSTLHAQ